MDLAIDHNVALASLGRLSRGAIIRRSAETALAADWATRLRLKYGRLKDPLIPFREVTSKRLSWPNGWRDGRRC